MSERGKGAHQMLATAKTKSLKPHPKNEAIYGREPDLPADFLNSVKRLGVLQPLVVKSDGTIISGHRRFAAAKVLEIEEVPVLIGSYASDLDEVEALVVLNQQRLKSPSQIAREGMELQRIEAERAAMRRKATQNNESGKAVDLNSDHQEGRSLDHVAASLGISRDRWYKLKTIFEKAESGDEEAAELLKALDAGDISVHKAYKTLREESDKATQAKVKAEGEKLILQNEYDYLMECYKDEQSKMTEEVARRIEELKQTLEPVEKIVEKQVAVEDPAVAFRLKKAEEQRDKYEMELKKIQQEGRDWRRLEDKKSKLENEITKLTMRASEKRTEMTLMTAIENVEHSRYISDRIHDMCQRGEMTMEQLDEAERVMNAMVAAGNNCLAVIQGERAGLVKAKGGLRVVE
jgi:ParB-like chromosome segregation protein Spo0J